MAAILLCLTGVSPLPAETAPPSSLSSTIRSLLPEKLRRVVPGTTTRDQITQLLGPPMNQVAAEVVSYPDTTIAFKDERVFLLLHEPPSDSDLGHLTLKKLADRIPRSAIAEAEQAIRTRQPNHETGRVLTVQLKGEGIRLEFYNREDRPLKSVQFSKARPEK